MNPQRLWMQFPISPGAKRDNWMSIYVTESPDVEEVELAMKILNVAIEAAGLSDDGHTVV